MAILNILMVMLSSEDEESRKDCRGHAWFLDRDGTLIVHKPYLCNPQEVELLPGVRKALHAAVLSGVRLFLFTNQSGVGRRYFSLSQAEACNQRMLDLLNLPAPGFAEICMATEAPDQPSLYRKPSPRFIVEMASKYGLSATKCWMIGDAASDVEAGRNAGVNSVWLGEQPPQDFAPEVWRCRNISEFGVRFAAMALT